MSTYDLDPSGVRRKGAPPPHRPSRRRLLATGAGGLAAIGVGACTPTAERAEPDPAATGDEDEVAEITFTSWSMNEATVEDHLGALLDDWSDRSDVEVRTPSYPYNDYLQQLLLQIRGGQAAGAAQTDIAWLATLAAAGRLVDLGESAGLADYTETALAATRVGGVQYGLPWTIAAIGMVYNADLLRDAGVDTEPETIEDFEAALESLLGLGVTPYAAMTKPAQLKDIIAWMWQFGSPVHDGDSVTLGDEGSVSAVTWYKDLLDRGLIALDVDRFDARALFAQGTVGFYEDAIGARNAIAASASDEAIVEAMTPLPRPVLAAGDEAIALAWGHAVVVFDGPGSRAATELAEHLTGDLETAIEYFSAASVAPTTHTALESPEVTGDEWVSAFDRRITSGGRPNPFWAFGEFAQIEERLGHHIQRVLIDEASPQDALNDARSDIEDLVNR